jgi:hypothetical protein
VFYENSFEPVAGGVLPAYGCVRIALLGRILPKPKIIKRRLSMAIRERVSHQIAHGKWDDMMEVEKGWLAIEQEIGGFPTKRASQPISGRDGMSVYIWERDWDSLTQMEAAYQSYQKFTGNASDLLEKTKACMTDRRADIYRTIE